MVIFLLCLCIFWDAVRRGECVIGVNGLCNLSSSLACESAGGECLEAEKALDVRKAVETLL
ncbi:hypothetical protein HMPREF0733_11212 [Rothia dentocariosa ATCC 17931]|uniref:Uncharacterized protein n=1 Tax=Rothia dentocariosa (strain ATCC 17931 / CDC X599 / XDIA) TaxID=762948 RepID=E3H4N6_ROTDC|nr:hypothetical protein HMPREF0733_11212 [Rothia dentocariosa ATCC 17931]